MSAPPISSSAASTAPASPAPPRGPDGREGEGRREGRGRRVLGIGVTLFCVLGLVGVALTWRWFVRPPVDGPVKADAIVMFGGAGPRFAKARQLAEEGYADVVVLSDPDEADKPFTAWGFFCRNTPFEGYEPHDYEAICFDPPTHTTRGESRFVAELARERGWRSVNLVTTTEQATRAKMLLARCWDGEIHSVTVATDLFRPARLLYEWAASARAAVERRDC